jgi:Protein of unknown function DUF262/Protein of unknown function (DUF1524)
MPLHFDTKMVHIGELFADANVFVMPAFQRPFCWDEETAAQLYDDISSAMMRGAAERPGRKNRQEYFLGPIIVTRGQAPGVLEVIDGQQRLATLAILLAILRDAFPADREFVDELQRLIVRPEHRLRRFPESPRVKLRPKDQDRFYDWVQTAGGTHDLPDEEDLDEDACARVRNAIVRITDDIGNPQDAYLRQLASFIVNNCYVIQITSRDIDDGYVLFRSLNSRGQPLRELDLAKAELLGAPPPSPDIDMAKLAEYWAEAENCLGEAEFTDYMHSVLALVATRPQGRDLRDLMREVVGDQLKARNFRILLASVLRHSSKLDEGVLEFGNDSERIHRVVQCLRQLPYPEWRSVALTWLATNPSAYNSLRFFAALESLCLGLLILGKNKTYRLRRLKATAAEVLAEREHVLEKAGVLRFSDAEQAQIKTILANPIGAKKGFLKPLLLRLNAHMLDPLIPLYFPESVTIEHVLPQRPAGDGPWARKYPNAQRRKHCTELLGNYALLTHPINARAKNSDFAEKRKVIFSETEHQAFAITNDLRNYEDWTEAELIDRHQKLVKVALSMLGLAPAIAWPAAAE